MKRGRKRKPFTSEEVMRIIQWREEGKSFREIAKKLGSTPGAIHSIYSRERGRDLERVQIGNIRIEVPKDKVSIERAIKILQILKDEVRTCR